MFDTQHYRIFVLGIFGFLVAFVVSAAVIPVANSSAESSVVTLTEATGITITNLGTISMNVSSPTSTGQIAKATDTVTVDATSAPNGYKLYISTPSTTNTNRLYLSGNTTSPSYIKPNQTNNVDVTYGNETTLAPNSWGFTTTSTNNTNNKYSAVPLYSAPALIASSNTATTANQSVYYAVNANTNLPAGNYTGTVVYTVLADAIEQTDEITSITPNYNTNQSSTQQVQIKVTFPVVIDSTASLTNITTTIGGSTCTSPSYALSNDTSGNQKILTVTCTAPTQSTTGAKDVIVSAEKGSFKYTFQSGTTETKKYYYNATRGVSLSPSSYTGSSSTTTSVTADFPAPVSSLGTTTAQWGSTTLSCSSKNTTKYTTYTRLTMTCTIPSRTSSTTQALTVTSTEFSGLSQSANFTYTYEVPFPTYMQDFTWAHCTSMSTTTASLDNRKTIRDSRDSKLYKIAKLADGNCWMVQNLALNGRRTLTPSDSDVTASRTLPSNISTSTSSDATSVQITSAVANNMTTSCGSYEYCDISGEPYGNLYNWYAATATTGANNLMNDDATDSVCPKGWKLPASQKANYSASSAPDRSYGRLMYQVLGFSGSNAVNTGGEYVKKIQQAPLWFSLAGHYDSGLSGQGEVGSYWSRKPYPSTGLANRLLFNANNGSFSPHLFLNKRIGCSVRCVFDPS